MQVQACYCKNLLKVNYSQLRHKRETTLLNGGRTVLILGPTIIRRTRLLITSNICNEVAELQPSYPVMIGKRLPNSVVSHCDNVARGTIEDLTY